MLLPRPRQPRTTRAQRATAVAVSFYDPSRKWRVHRSRLLDHLIGSGQQCLRDGEAERVGSGEIDDEFELSWLYHRKVGGFLALEDTSAAP